MWNFKKILGISLSLLLLVILFLFQNTKKKSDYDTVTGYVEVLDHTYKTHPSRNLGKYRYLKIDKYPYPFELFIGKDAGDFKPKFERIDQLDELDLLTVYFYETNSTHQDGLNRFAQFIDKDGESYYERGSSQFLLGLVLLLLPIGLIVGGYLLYKQGKIPL